MVEDDDMQINELEVEVTTGLVEIEAFYEEKIENLMTKLRIANRKVEQSDDVQEFAKKKITSTENDLEASKKNNQELEETVSKLRHDLENEKQENNREWCGWRRCLQPIHHPYACAITQGPSGEAGGQLYEHHHNEFLCWRDRLAQKTAAYGSTYHGWVNRCVVV